jgi:hypothetical protein
MQQKIRSFTQEDADIGKSLNITQKRRLNWTVYVLHEFTTLLSNAIAAWETFENGEIRYFCNPHSDEFVDASWGIYVAAIIKDATELRALRSSLQRETELFLIMTKNVSSRITFIDKDAKTFKLINHAQHEETSITRVQSNFIQALTVITIVR